MTCTLILDAHGVVTAAVRSNGAQIPPDGGSVALVDDETFAAARADLGKVIWHDGELQPYEPIPAPKALPLAVTRLQGRLGLSRAGLLDKVEAAVAAAGSEMAIWYADAQVWHRNDPHLVAIGQALALGPAEVDALFVEAAAI